jgi:hypothetical protein
VTSIFGNLVTPSDVARAVEDHIRLWGRAYLDFVRADATRKGDPFPRRLPPIASYRHTNDRPEKWPEDAIPCVVIFNGPGEPNGQGETISLDFAVGIGVVVGADDVETTDRLAKTYAAALSLLFVQKPGLSVGEAVSWGGFQDVPVEREDQRNLSMGVFGLIVHVPDAMTVYGGPEVPVPDPQPGVPPVYGETPTADTVTVRAGHIDDLLVVASFRMPYESTAP